MLVIVLHVGVFLCTSLCGLIMCALATDVGNVYMQLCVCVNIECMFRALNIIVSLFFHGKSPCR